MDVQQVREVECGKGLFRVGDGFPVVSSACRQEALVQDAIAEELVIHVLHHARCGAPPVFAGQPFPTELDGACVAPFQARYPAQQR